MTQSDSRTFKTGLLCAVIGSIAFSGKSIIIKLAYRYGVDAVTLLMFRMLFSLPVFLLLAWWGGRGKAALTRRDWLGVTALAFVGYYLGSFLDFAGLQYITASLGRLIMYLNPTLVLLLGMLFLGKRVRWQQVVAIGVSYSGIALVFGHELATTTAGKAWSDIGLGGALVFASALSYAVYLLFSAELVKRLGSMRLVGLATSMACLMCITQFAILRPISAATSVAPEVIGLSVLNASLCTVFPVLLVMMAIERIGPAITSQIGMIGPIATLFMGIALLDEPLTGWVIAGTLLVLAGIYLVTQSAASQTQHLKPLGNTP